MKESIKKNIFYNILYQILVIILPIITMPYISRILGTDGVGIYSYTYSIVYYFILGAMLGINNYGNREIAKVRENNEKLSETFSSIYVLQLIMSSIMIVLYSIYSIFIVKNNKDIALIQTIYLIATMFDINWFFFGLEKFKLTVTRNTIIKILTVICIFIFVKEKSDLYLYTIILSAGTLISQLLLWPFVKKYTKFKKVKFNEIKQHIKPCLILFIPVIAVSLYKLMDKIMLGNMCDMDQVGLYENAEKTTSILTSLITAIGTVMLPRMSNLFSNGEEEKGKKYIEKSLKFIIIISLALCFGLISVAKGFTVIFFGEQFSKSGELIQLLSSTTIFIAVANVIRTQYLIPKGKDISYIISVSLGAIINIVFNIILIPKYNANGAAIATVLAEFSVMLYQILDVKKEIRVIGIIKENIGYAFIAVIMLFINYIIGQYLNNKFNIIIVLIIQVITGMLIYSSSAIMLLMKQYKEKNIKQLILKIRE